MIRVGSIVIRCYEFDKMVKFWQQALGYEPLRSEGGGFTVLHDPNGKGPNISLDRAPEKRKGKRSWIHLDLYANGKEDQQAEVERLVSIGATRYPWRYEPGADYVVLEDPDGNLFCIIE